MKAPLAAYLRDPHWEKYGKPLGVCLGAWSGSTTPSQNCLVGLMYFASFVASYNNT